MADTTDTIGMSLNFLSTSNFLMSLILGGSLQQLWGMIRALQMIILVALIDIQIPAPTLVFFQGCILIAQMDLIGGEAWYANNMNFLETTPYT